MTAPIVMVHEQYLRERVPGWRTDLVAHESYPVSVHGLLDAIQVSSPHVITLLRAPYEEWLWERGETIETFGKRAGWLEPATKPSVDPGEAHYADAASRCARCGSGERAPGNEILGTSKCLTCGFEPQPASEPLTLSAGDVRLLSGMLEDAASWQQAHAERLLLQRLIAHGKAKIAEVNPPPTRARPRPVGPLLRIDAYACEDDRLRVEVERSLGHDDAGRRHVAAFCRDELPGVAPTCPACEREMTLVGTKLRKVWR